MSLIEKTQPIQTPYSKLTSLSADYIREKMELFLSEDKFFIGFSQPIFFIISIASLYDPTPGKNTLLNL